MPWTAAVKLGCSPTRGNPCSIATGAKIQTFEDYRASGGGALAFERTYDSALAARTRFGSSDREYFTPVGIGWSATYFQYLEYVESATRTTAFVYRPDGRRLFFNLIGGVMQSTEDIHDELTVVRDGSGAISGFEYRVFPENLLETYDEQGRLLSIRGRGGRTQTLTYGSYRYPLSVTDSFGHTLTFIYDASAMQRLVGLLLPDGVNQISFSYSGKENLSTVLYADGYSVLYQYSSSSTSGNLLTGIVDEAATQYSTYTYEGSYGRMASTEHAGGTYRFSFAYPSSSSRTVTDPLNQVRTFSTGVRQGSRLVTGSSALTPGSAEPKAATYDNNANLLSKKDFGGQLTCYAYDLTRNLEVVRVEGFDSTVTSCPSPLITYTPAAGTRERVIATQWHSTFRQPTLITESGRTTAYTYDSNSNPLTKTITDTATSTSRTWIWTYDSYGRVLTEGGPRTDVSDVTTYTYYTCTSGFECGQLHTATNALNQATTYNTYDAHGQPLTITDPNGVVTTLTYDLRQRLTSRTVGGETTTLEYWPTGLLKKVRQPGGDWLAYTYDGAHRLTRIDDSEGHYIVYTLDNMGNRTAENAYDPTGMLRRTHTRVYNSLNQLWKDVNAAGTAAVTTEYAYDANDNQTSISAPLLRQTGQLYDELNRLKQITDPASGVTQFAYDAQDQLVSVTDPRNLVTSYQYNGLGDLTQLTSPDTGVTVNTYDSGGNLSTSTDARSAVAEYAYDALNRVTEVDYGDQLIEYVYDAGTYGKGRLTGASDADHAIGWTYDALGRVTAKAQTVGAVTHTVGYGYTAGRLTSLTTPSGQSVAYGYGAHGQITSISINGTPLLHSALYEPFGPVAGWTWGNGSYAVRTYDTDGRITQVDSGGLKTYAYDDASRLTGLTDTVNAANSWTYAYDALDRLTGGTSSAITRGWTYDANGNRLSESGTAPSTYTYTIPADSNRIASISGALARTYGYDAAGHTTGYAGATFTYNQRGRMSSATVGGNTATYTYNALEQRAKRVGPSGTTLYVHDEAGHLLGEYDGSGGLIQETVWLGDIPVATLRPSGGGIEVFYVHTDHLNTPRLVTRPSDNAERWRWDSDPFGTNLPDEDPAGLGAFAYSLRFPGQLFDGLLGLHQNYFRDYDPATGRYIQSDPIGLHGGVNIYAYVGGNPFSYTDVLGLIRRCVELWSFRDYESKDWSTVQTLYGKEFLAPGPGGGQLSPGADLDPPTPRSPRGGVSPGVDVRLMLWWVRWMQTKGEEGYMLRSFIRGYMECREDDPCKDPAVTNHAITRDYTPWKSVATREVNENELQWLRPYGETWLPVPLPGMPRFPR